MNYAVTPNVLFTRFEAGFRCKCTNSFIVHSICIIKSQHRYRQADSQIQTLAKIALVRTALVCTAAATVLISYRTATKLKAYFTSKLL